MANATPPSAQHFCTAVAWVRLGHRQIPVLPVFALKCFLIFLIGVAAAIALLEWQLGTFGAEGRVASVDWKHENRRIYQMDKAKITADQRMPLWRSAGMPAKPAEGRRRILVLGDSFVWGDGYSNANDIWWRQLERELRQRGYGDVDVIAAGVNGASTQDQLRWLKTLGVDSLGSPDVIIFGYVTNDPEVRRADGSPFVKQLGDIAGLPRWRFLDKTLGRVAPNITAQLQQRRIAKVQTRIPNVYPYAEWELKLLEPPNFDAYREVVHDLATTMRAIGVPYFFITLPNSPNRAHFTQRYTPIEPLFAASGIAFHNILDDFVAADPLGSEVLQWGINPANGHPGPVSTRFYARKAADILEQQYPHILGVKSPEPIAPVLAINDWMPPEIALRSVGFGVWEFTYPPDGSDLLRMPIGARHVLLSFAEPVALSRLTLSGERLVAAQVYLGSVDVETGIEDRTPMPLGRRTGAEVTWDLASLPAARAANTVRLIAEFAPGGDEATRRRLRLRALPSTTVAARLP